MKRFIISLVIILSLSISALATSVTELKADIIKQENRMSTAHIMAEAARELGYEENSIIIQLAQEDWWEAYYQKQNDNAELTEWLAKEKEYPAASYIWSYFTDLGYNEYVTAGILGNIMTEVGGQTLNIQYWLSSGYYYGMCQWNKNYSSVWGASLEEQCEYLADTLEYEFDTFGYAYKRGFDYEEFISLASIEQAAKAFAVCYERCGSASYAVRQANALKAYNYFVN